jgi:CubicO group peptidase (beta-lactamase class C family)
VVDKAIRTFEVPGLAMAIIKNDEVIFLRGFGYRDLENKIPMTPDTLLAIGSSTKAFTVFTLGTLVDQGLMEWDKPVRNYISWFRLYDPFASERLTPRDMVTHRSGLPRHDLVWYNNYTASREAFVRRLAFLEPTADLREKFQYNNLMFLTAGYLAEVLTGKKWEEAVREKVLNPLEMTRTNFSVKDSQKDSDFSQPYDERGGKIQRIPFRDITNIGPAGSINSSANEMANWVIVHVNGGKFKGKQIIDAAILEDMHLSHMPLGETPERPEITPTEYGMGWFTDTYRGHSRVSHGGNIDGFSALVSILPQDRIGFVILTNKNGTGLPEMIVRTASDRVLELEAIAWLDEASKRRDEGKAASKEAEKKKAVKRVLKTRPAHELEAYAGDYRHPGYGELLVFLKNNRLHFTYNGITTPLGHWHFETFNGGKSADPTFEDMKLTFRTDVNGLVSELVAPFEPTLDEIRFRKQPDARLSDPGFLKQFVGKYEILDMVFTISLKGEYLSVYVPGQPVYDLVPQLGGEFIFKQVKIISLKFVQDKTGKVTGFQLFQSNGVYEAKRILDN